MAAAVTQVALRYVKPEAEAEERLRAASKAAQRPATGQDKPQTGEVQKEVA